MHTGTVTVPYSCVCTYLQCTCMYVCKRLVLYVQDWYYVYWARMVLNWARLVVYWATGAIVAKRCVLESTR